MHGHWSLYAFYPPLFNPVYPSDMTYLGFLLFGGWLFLIADGGMCISNLLYTLKMCSLLAWIPPISFHVFFAIYPQSFLTIKS